jgi:glyoxylase-like metal-dependent hydrolase (beta-lactamase superfamily II)
MSVHRVFEGFYFIERGYLNGNHFVFLSESPALVDTGFVSHWAVTRALIAGLGVDVRRVGLIVSTHTHCDHVGGNRFVEEASGCEIALHPVGKLYMDTRDDWNTWWRYYDQEPVFFTATRALEDGEVLVLGGSEWEVLHTPGHSRDGISLFNRRERVLISGDALWERDTPPMSPQIEGLGCVDRALASLERIERLGAKLVLPGHGAAFTDVGAAVDANRSTLLEYMRNTEKMARDLVKKALIFQILMRRRVEEGAFMEAMLSSTWYKDTCRRFIGEDYSGIYRDMMQDFLARGIVVESRGVLSTVVKP